MAEGTCSWDDCERTVRARGFCARHYYMWQRSGRPWPDVTPKVCPHCGSTFLPVNAHQKWCSQRCNGNAWAAKEAAKRDPKPDRTCRQCGVRYRPRAHNQVHCSHECVLAARRSRHTVWPERMCLRCGRSFQPTHWRAKYCSEKCRQRTNQPTCRPPTWRATRQRGIPYGRDRLSDIDVQMVAISPQARVALDAIAAC